MRGELVTSQKKEYPSSKEGRQAVGGGLVSRIGREGEATYPKFLFLCDTGNEVITSEEGTRSLREDKTY